MWIVPKNIPVYRFVQDMGGLNLESSELAQISERSLMWRGKDSLARTWSQRWNRVSWMQHLFGRILRPSMESLFAGKWTSSLPAIRARVNRAQESDSEKQTPDGFGRILRESCRQLDLFGASSRTSLDTLPLDSPKFTEAYEIWVTQLRQDYLARQSVARPTNDADCLSWHSPRSLMIEEHPSKFRARMNSKRKNDRKDGLPNLAVQVNWPTPDSMMDSNANKKSNRKNCPKNFQEGINWPTPKTPTGGGQPKRLTAGGGIRKLEDKICGLLDQDSPNTNGKSQGLWPTPASQLPGDKPEKLNWTEGGKPYRKDNKRMVQTALNLTVSKTQKGKLNPDWVEQLMGLPVGWTDYGFSATESSSSRQKKHLGI